MAGKKPLTKAQIVSYFAKKFDLSKKLPHQPLKRWPRWQSARPKRPEPLPSPASENLSLLDVKPVWVEIQPQVSQLISRPRPW